MISSSNPNKSEVTNLENKEEEKSKIGGLKLNISNKQEESKPLIVDNKSNIIPSIDEKNNKPIEKKPFEMPKPPLQKTGWGSNNENKLSFNPSNNTPKSGWGNPNSNGWGAPSSNGWGNFKKNETDSLTPAQIQTMGKL